MRWMSAGATSVKRLSWRTFVEYAVACALGALALGAAAPRALAQGSLASAAAQGPAPTSQSLSLVLPLQFDQAGLRRFALAVSTPGSPQYGEYESIEALTRRFGATQDVRARVLRYLRGVGATGVQIDATGLFADATLSTGLAERLFETPLAQFREGQNVPFVAPTGPTAPAIPVPLRGLVTGVVGLDTRPLLAPSASAATAAATRAPAPAATSTATTARRRRTRPQPASGYGIRTGTAAGCAAGLAPNAFTPNQYLTAYGYGPLLGASIAGQGERVALIEIDGFNDSDIATFASCFGVHVPPIQAFPVGLKRALAPGAEATLDLEILSAAAPGLSAIDVYESHGRAADAMRALTAPLRARTSRPEVISASIGLCEPYVAKDVGRGGIRASEGALQMAAASGITVVSSSGDSGSADCPGRRGPAHRLAVNYPASSRWVTGVGGTNFALNAANQIRGQIVWNDTKLDRGAAGGGGFSDLFGRPSYQRGTVAPNRRVVPDVSMLADVAPGYAIYCTAAPDCINSMNTNPWLAIGGTSAGTPLLAGGFALVDQVLRERGRQELGLANPLIYALGRSKRHGQVFDDVTRFGNDVGAYINGNGRSLGCCRARRGFDAASGWGSINVTAFTRAALARQPRIARIGLALPRRQNPIRRHRIRATVSCSRNCLAKVAVAVTAGRSTLFGVESGILHLSRRGGRTISLRFSRGDLRALRAARARHETIIASVICAIVDPSGNAERFSRARRVRIRN